MRKTGSTHREIAKALGISVSSAHEWTRGIFLTEEQKHDVQKRKTKQVYTPARRKQLSESAKRNLFLALPKYTKQDLLKKIQDFHRIHGRIPLKREFNMWRVYQSRFESWNNAIVAAGFEPNPVYFAKHYLAQDGHPCDSFTEKIIDDWMSLNEVPHRRNVPYDGTTMTADFSIGDVFIEYFGLWGEVREYDVLVKKKRALCKKQGRKLIEIYPEDLSTQDYRVFLERVVEGITP